MQEVAIEIPDALARRLLADDDGLTLVLDDDRGARWLSLGLGSLALVGLTAGVTSLGLAWPLAIVAVPVLGVLTAAVAARWGHRAVRVHVSAWGVELDGRAVAWADVRAIERETGVLVVRRVDGIERVALHGEDDDTIAALVDWLRRQPSP